MYLNCSSFYSRTTVGSYLCSNLDFLLKTELNDIQKYRVSWDYHIGSILQKNHCAPPEQWTVVSGRHQLGTLFLLSYAVATPLQWITTVREGIGEWKVGREGVEFRVGVSVINRLKEKYCPLFTTSVASSSLPTPNCSEDTIESS